MRFQFIEQELREQGKIAGDVSLEELEALWILAKQAEKSLRDGE